MNRTLPKNARSVALLVLHELEDGDSYLQPCLEAMARRAELSPRDRALALELAMGVLRWRARLDHSLSQYLSRSLDSTDERLVGILRLALYQLIFLDRIPPRAAVFEAVEQARTLVHEGGARFVNGLLRRFLQNGEKLPEGNSPKELAAKLSFPIWLCERWLKRDGLEKTLARAAANNAHAPLIIRPDLPDLTSESLEALLVSEGAQVKHRPYATEALLLEHATPFALQSFREHKWCVQDEAAQLVVELLDPQPGEKIWDTCAAPGGKSRLIWRQMKGQGSLLSTDAHPGRTARMARELADLPIEVSERDASKPQNDGERYDRILIDAPCTGLGVLRRHPEIRWRRTPNDIKACAERQRRILEAASQSLRKGGVLVYAVCSPTDEEGPGVLQSFLSKHTDFIEDLPEAFATRCGALIQNGTLRTDSLRDDLDGFFAARIRRKAD